MKVKDIKIGYRNVLTVCVKTSVGDIRVCMCVYARMQGNPENEHAPM